MLKCPHCDSELNHQLVKSVPLGERKWYKYSSVSLLDKVCSICNNKIVVKYNTKWFYKLGLPLIILPNLILKSLDIELTIPLKLLLLFIAVIGIIITFRQNRDFRYITYKEEENERIKNYIKYAQGHFEKPIESSEYCQKYLIEKSKLDNLVSKGLIEAYAINRIDYFEDKAPNYKI